MERYVGVVDVKNRKTLRHEGLYHSFQNSRNIQWEAVSSDSCRCSEIDTRVEAQPRRGSSRSRVRPRCGWLPRRSMAPRRNIYKVLHCHRPCKGLIYRSRLYVQGSLPTLLLSPARNRNIASSIITQIPPTSPYQASLAKNPLGHRLTAAFRASSTNKSPIPKATGRKKYSTGTAAEPRTLCRPGG